MGDETQAATVGSASDGYGTLPTGRPRWLRDGAQGPAIPLTPVPLRDRDVSESDLQRLLDEHPDLIPIDDIGAAWGPLISLGRELGIDRGFIDNLYVSPAGDLTVVEAKLWRNPEARRKVVGQILDYAAELATLSYEQLDEVVMNSGGRDRRSIWQRVCDWRSQEPEAQRRFVDVASRNLQEGRFLLLVVGDGIRSALHSISDLVGSHPSLAFHLELIELRLYRMPDGSLMVVPNVVGRTVESVSRAVVRVSSPEGVDVDIVVDASPANSESNSVRGRFVSVDAFLAALEEATDVDRAKAVGDLIHWWQVERNGVVKLNKTSVNLSVPFAYKSGGGVSVMTIYAGGWAQGSVAPMVEWREIVPLDEALPPFVAAGFDVSDQMWPVIRPFDLTHADAMGRVEKLLTWAELRIRSASADRD
jgi:hypothetical protein